MGWYIGHKGLRGWFAAKWLNIHDALFLALMVATGWRVGSGRVDNMGILDDVRYCLRHPGLPGLLFVHNTDGWVITHEQSGLSLACYLDHHDTAAFNRARAVLCIVDWTRPTQTFAKDKDARTVVNGLRNWLHERYKEDLGQC